MDLATARCVLLYSLISATQSAISAPNIVFFLTDDQDQMLGGSFPTKDNVTPMPKIQQLLATGGATFTNMFAHTPICNPSRSEILTGRMLHNIKQIGKWGGSMWSMHVDEDLVHNHTFMRSLNEDAGYATGLFGKYLNVMPDHTAGADKPRDGSRGAPDVVTPAGFTAFMGNPGGDYIAPEFETHGLSDLGIEDGIWQGTTDDYTTAVVGNTSIAWIRHVVTEDPTRPFFAYVAPKAAHEPFMPAPWYVEAWDDAWPTTEPRDNPAWNSSIEDRADHPSDIAVQPMLSEAAAGIISDVFKNRWRTLMSVDDVIAAFMAECDALGITDNTYFFFSSDHGFQLGQFNILMDKRRVYEWDTRVHLLVKGPGIVPGSQIHLPAMNIDLAPTFLDLAGVTAPSHMFPMDGHSLAPLLLDIEAKAVSRVVTDSTRRALKAYPPREVYVRSWRDTVFHEYYFVNDNDKCTVDDACVSPRDYPLEDSWCGNLTVIPNEACWAGEEDSSCGTVCFPTESVQNNFIAVHNVSQGILYVEYQTGNQTEVDIRFDAVDFYELYDVKVDRWHMNNLHDKTDPKKLARLHGVLLSWFQCAADSCP